MDALVRALEEGWIGGAGLDVLPEEPLPDDSRLWRMENVVITPHGAGNSPERAGRNLLLVIENLRRFASGAPLLSVVARRVRY
jgi:phosphoglycerate dehydrogenase-like enzyme